MPPTDRFVNETTFYVRYAETDMMGIVHHATYLIWFEEGRSAYIREKGGSYSAIEASGYFLAASELNARYVKAAIYDRQITVKCWIESYKSRVMVFGCEIVDTETADLLFEATAKLICLNRDGQVTRMPSEWEKWLSG